MVLVQITKKFNGIEIDTARLKKLVKAVCNRFKLSKATVSIALIDDAEITAVNKRFLNRDFTTDCLSFDLSDDEPDSPRLFDLLINAEKAVREANLLGHSSQAEVALYITHALLHNLGFDDSLPRQAKKMHDTEDRILQQQGFGLVYNNRTRALK